MRASLLLALLLLAACAGSDAMRDLERTLAGFGARGPARTVPLRESFDGPDRPWPGAAWYANRGQDWEVAGGRVLCTYPGRPNGGRTLALLTREVQPGAGRGLALDLVLGAAEPGSWSAHARAGVLLGVGGPEVDWRRSAAVQQAPGADGGLLVSIGPSGYLSVRDFEQPVGGGGWTLPGGVDGLALPLLAESSGALDPTAGPIALRLRGSASGLVARAVDGAGTAVELACELAPEALVGRLSLYSAGGAASGGGFAFDDLLLEGCAAHPERARGPVLAATYLVARPGGGLADGPGAEGPATLRLAAHVVRLGASGPRNPRLWLADPERPGADDAWVLAALGEVQVDGSSVVRFVVPGYEDLPGGGDRRFRVELGVADADGRVRPAFYDGLVRAEPGPGEQLVVGSLSCLKNQVGPIAWNASGLWFPHEDVAAGVLAQDPDLVFFAGDQIYEGDITGVDGRSLEHSMEDYRTKYERFLWSFEELLRTRPSVLLPDDHDVYHGNLWGAGGILAEKVGDFTLGDSGGYKMPAEFVNAVHGTLVGNLPPTRLAPVVGQGITTYSTAFSWGGVDFCVLADRMFKDSPSIAAPAGDYRNGWPQAPGYDPRDPATAGDPAARLLGPDQETMLAAWAANPAPGTWTRVVLSQSPFACLHTLPAGTEDDGVVPSLPIPGPGEYPPDDRPVADGDSNGWPRAASLRARRLLAEAGALHLAGDQHLGTVAQYGLDGWRDGTVAYTSPAMGNTWPRRWMPAEPGADRAPGAPRTTGDFVDGFGNHVTMLATSNPVEEGREPRLLYNRAPGWGLVRFDPGSRRVRLEAWPRWVEDPLDDDGQFAGWPLVLGPDGRPLEQAALRDAR